MAQEIVIPLIVALIAAIPGVYAVIRQSRKDQVDNASVISKTALEQVAFYRQEVLEMRAQMDAQDLKITNLEGELVKERKQRVALEELNTQKDIRIAAMQTELDTLRASIEAIQLRRR